MEGYERASEAMIWVSGYNTTVDEIGRAVGQMLAVSRRIYQRAFTEFISGVIRGNFRAGLPRPFGVTVVLLKS